MKKTYIEGIDLDTIKIGDKLWFKEDSCIMEIGIVSKVEGTKVWANWKSEGNEDSRAVAHFIDVSNDYSDTYCTYGTIKEEEEMQVNQNSNKHPQYDVIVHWASGGEIQYYDITDEKWEDYPDDYKFNPSWSYYEFRIKPDTKKIKYRTALLRNNTIKVFTENLSLDDVFGDDAFKHWLDPDWKELELEVEV